MSKRQLLTQRILTCALSSLVILILSASCAHSLRIDNGVDVSTVDSATQYQPASSKPPFEIDVDSADPFTKHGIQIESDEVAGIELVWLERPQSATSLPRWALITNRTASLGGLYLISEDGEVVASVDDIGMIQQIRIVRVAPVESPQLLIFNNPGHGTGYLPGEFCLFEFDGCRLRQLVRGPRYTLRSMVTDEVKLGLPILIRDPRIESRLLVVQFSILDSRAGGPSDIEKLGLEWGLMEFEWNAEERRYREIAPARADALFSSTPDAWTWSSEYVPRSE